MWRRGLKLGNGKATCKRDEIHPKCWRRRVEHGEANSNWHFKGKTRVSVTSHHECPSETLESRLLVSNIIRINPSRNRGHKERLNDSSVGVGDLKLETEEIKRYLTYFERALHRNAWFVRGVRSFSAVDARRMFLISLFRSGPRPSDCRSRRLILNRLDPSVKIGMHTRQSRFNSGYPKKGSKPHNEDIEMHRA